ncbi:hypothetical protein FGB62_33g175 [Gracilaria domingensis]|nr:hypothetical protein FGB62_33g175 [Gracilaria domingensis]
MAAPALAATATSLTVFALGSVANVAASNKPLAARSWLPSGGFVGVVNGHGSTAVAEPNAPSTPQARPTGSNSPIGGKTDKPAPPCPFGRFPKHKPTKLPGPPKPYSPADSP